MGDRRRTRCATTARTSPLRQRPSRLPPPTLPDAEHMRFVAGPMDVTFVLFLVMIGVALYDTIREQLPKVGCAR